MERDTNLRERTGDVLILVAGGFLATLLVTLVAQPVASFLGFPTFDFAKGLVHGFTSQEGVPYSSAWWVAMAVHFFIGSAVFPLVFGIASRTYFPDWPLGAGLGLGVALWFVSQLVLSPLAGLGVFGRLTEDPALLGFVSFNAHVLYGLVLGLTGAYLLNKSKEKREEIVLDRKAA